MRRVAFLAPIVLMFAAACSTAQPGTPAPSALPSPPATPGATVSPSTPVTPSGSPEAPSPTVTPAPTDSPAPAMTRQERQLVAILRPDAAVNCVPRRDDLPEGARWGIECHPNDPLVARVGVYDFPTEIDAARAYMTRMADSGVDVNSGDCGRDQPGETAWVPGDGEGDIDDPGVFNFENEALSPERAGCFLNEDGIANTRVTCGVYIGVLGTGKDLSDLYDWTWKYPEGYEHSTPEPPGICVNGT